MEATRRGVPLGMWIAMVVCLALGLAARPIVGAMDPQQLARTVIVAALPFILIFASIVLLYMNLIWLLASRLNDRIAADVHRPVERALVGGIVLGVLFMFQPWLFVLFRPGFFILLLATLGFIAWSHVRPA